METIRGKHRYFNERPMLCGAPAALLGAFLATRLGGPALWVAGGLAVLLGVFLLWREKSLFALPLLLGLLLLRGALLPGVKLISGTYEVTGTVIAPPERVHGNRQAVLGWVGIGGWRVPGALALLCPDDVDLVYGDRLTLPARLSPAEEGAVEGLTAVLYTGVPAGTAQITSDRGDPLYGLALRWRQHLSEAADALFGDLAGPAKGMLFGDRNDVFYLTFQDFRRSGMLHLLTVSGLHVGVVCGAALQLIRGRRRWLRFGLSAMVLLLFCMLTGLAPSSVRAAVMLLTARLSRLLDRQDDPLSEIGCALTLLLLLDPWLLFCPGFRLSFGAVFGLACLQGPLLTLFHGQQTGVGGLLAGAAGVFLGTMPLLSVTGGEIAWLGVFVSLLALPAAPLFLLPGWIAVLVYPLLPGLARVVALLPKGVLYYLKALARLVPAAGITVPPAGGWALLLYFGGMLLVSEYFLPNRDRPAYLGWGLMMAGALVWFLL